MSWTATAGAGASSSSGSSGASSGGGADNASGPSTDMTASAAPDASANTVPADAAAGSANHDGAARSPDASASRAGEAGTVLVPPSGDGGLSPYKGVANSPCGDLMNLGASWYYNWKLSPDTAGCTAAQFVPMIWGHTGAEQSATGITSEVSGLVSAGYDTVLGFNEPDNSSQSAIPVATAISLWPSFTSASVRLGSPATQANTTGQAWFTTFMNQVNADTTGQLRVDFIAAHWYGWNSGSCDAKASSLESYIQWLEKIPGNRPIWLTEWGCLNQSNPTAAVVQAFFSGAITMLGKHPRVERYAWYPWTTNNELVTNGALTSLGTAFAAEAAHR